MVIKSFDQPSFALKMIFFAFSISKIDKNKSVLSLTINYRLSPGFVTNLMKWKIRKMERDILTGYKNYIETGEKNTPIATLATRNYQFS